MESSIMTLCLLNVWVATSTRVPFYLRLANHKPAELSIVGEGHATYCGTINAFAHEARDLFH